MTLTELLIESQMRGRRVESYNPTDEDLNDDDTANDELSELLTADDEEFDWRGRGINHYLPRH